MNDGSPEQAASSERADLPGDIDRATLAHELRTPLSAIIAIAEVMKDERLGPMGNARYRAYAGDIHESARHALSLLDGLIGNSEPGRSIATDVVETVRVNLSAMQPLAEQASISFEAALPADPLHVTMSRRHLTQILLNLLSNAIRFTPAGGMVEVSARHLDEGWAELAVTDTGTGMTAAGIERALSGRNARPALSLTAGFGLPLVQAIAASYGGRVEISSAPGKGTRVSVLFPADGMLRHIDQTAPAHPPTRA